MSGTLVSLAIASLLLTGGAAPALPTGDKAQVLAALHKEDPAAALDAVTEWNGGLAALSRTTAEDGSAVVTLVALVRKGAKLAVVGSFPVCTLEKIPPEDAGASHTCALDKRKWPLGETGSAIGVVEDEASPTDRDASHSSRTLHLFWLDDEGLREILQATLKEEDRTSDLGLYNLDLKSDLEVLPTKSLGLSDLKRTETRVTQHPEADVPPAQQPEREPPQTATAVEVYRYDGVSYSTGSQLDRPKITASSQLQEKGRPPGFYAPEKMQDGRLSTAWAEGVKGPGAGEKITFTWKSAVSPKTFVIYGACSDSPKYFRENHRLKTVELSLSNGFKQTLKLADLMVMQRFPLKAAGKATSATLTIVEVYESAKYDDTCIAEAYFE